MHFPAIGMGALDFTASKPDGIRGGIPVVPSEAMGGGVGPDVGNPFIPQLPVQLFRQNQAFRQFDHGARLLLSETDMWIFNNAS